MGTFADLFKKDGAQIPESKIPEFKERLEKLYQAGGMMEIKTAQLYDKEIPLLKLPTMHEDGMQFHYNYFEEAAWESAGFSAKRGEVWSGKIGWMEFHRAMVSAYVLEEHYIDGPAIATVNGEPVLSRAVVGWLNYLFQENYGFKNRDPWGIYEALHDYSREHEWEYPMKHFEWKDFAVNVCGDIGYFEILAVTEGTDKVIEKIDEFSKSEDEEETLERLESMKQVRDSIRKFNQTNPLSKEEQLGLLLEMMQVYYEQDDLVADLGEKYSDLRKVQLDIASSDAPAFAFMVFAEEYDKDFWGIWNTFKHLARRRLYKSETLFAPVKQITTIDFFKLSSDDMILYYQPNGDIEFSEELRCWFHELKEKFEKVVKNEFKKEQPLKWIFDLMEYADFNYYRIFTFYDFFEETMEHLADVRYLALWKVYDELLHDPELEEAGSVIFVPEGPEYEHLGIHYWEKTKRRRLRNLWDCTEGSKRNNKARVTLRRYMALVTNKELRKEVFGF